MQKLYDGGDNKMDKKENRNAQNTKNNDMEIKQKKVLRNGRLSNR